MSRPLRLRLFRTVRLLLPALATLSLATLLVFTIIFTEFDWQWVAFLSGVLVAAVLSLVSASWKAQWRVARRTAQLAKMKDRLAAETVTHRRTGEQLTRELALHQQDRERLARSAESLGLTERRLGVAQGALRALARHLPAAACFLDSELRCRFHTRLFATRIGKTSQQIDGQSLDELFAGDAAQGLRTALADARSGGAAKAQLPIHAADGTPATADLISYHGAAGQAGGMLVILREPGALRGAAGAPAAAKRERAMAEHPAGSLRLTDESGQAVYLRSLTEELMGWSDPRARIRNAIEQDGFELHAQDIVALRAELRPERMAELLIRMRDEEEHHLPPGAFFPAAEQFGLMPDIDRWVVGKITAAWAPGGRAQLPLACINAARATIADRAFPEFVAQALKRHGVRGDSLCFELSDNDVIAAPEEASRFAGELKQLGCRISLDGFGGAEVDFDRVKSLPLDYLKIDGRIILAIARDAVAAAKVTAIRRVCGDLGVRTVAEMVESDDVLSKLRSLGVDYAQGFGIARPKLLGAPAGAGGYISPTSR